MHSPYTINQTKIFSLTQREKEIIYLLAYEYSTKEIANLLYLSSETVKTHRSNIFSKLNAKNMAGAVRIACQSGIISQETKLNIAI